MRHFINGYAVTIRGSLVKIEGYAPMSAEKAKEFLDSRGTDKWDWADLDDETTALVKDDEAGWKRVLR